MSNFRPRLFLFSLFYIDNNNNNISTRGSIHVFCLFVLLQTSPHSSYTAYHLHHNNFNHIETQMRLPNINKVLQYFTWGIFPTKCCIISSMICEKTFPQDFPNHTHRHLQAVLLNVVPKFLQNFDVVPEFLQNFDVVPEFLQNFECWILNVEFWTLCQNCREFLQNSHVKIEICLCLLCCGINLVKCSSY